MVRSVPRRKPNFLPLLAFFFAVGGSVHASYPPQPCPRKLALPGIQDVSLTPEHVARIQAQFSDLKLTADQVLHIDEILGPSLAHRRARAVTSELLWEMRGNQAWVTTLFHTIEEWDAKERRWVLQAGFENRLDALIRDEWTGQGLSRVAMNHLVKELKSRRVHFDSPGDLRDAIERTAGWFDRETTAKYRSKLFQYAQLHKLFSRSGFTNAVGWHLRNAWSSQVEGWGGWNPVYSEDLDFDDPHRILYSLRGTLARYIPGLTDTWFYHEAVVDILNFMVRNRALRQQFNGARHDTSVYVEYFTKNIAAQVRKARNATRFSTPPHVMRREGLTVFEGEIDGIRFEGFLEELDSLNVEDSKFGLNTLRYICQKLGYQLLLVGDRAVGSVFKIQKGRKVDVVAVELVPGAVSERRYILHCFELKESRPGVNRGHHNPMLATKADIEHAFDQLANTDRAIGSRGLNAGTPNVVLLPNSVIDVGSGYNIFYHPTTRSLRLQRHDVPYEIAGKPVLVHFVSD